MANGSSTTPAGVPRMVFVPYFYIAGGVALVGSGSLVIPLLLDEDADFEFHKITASSDLDITTDYRPNNFTVQITDKNNSRIWSSARIPQVAFVLSGGYVLQRPVLLSRRSNLSFDFLNLSSDTMTPTLVLHGFKVLGN